MVKTNAVMLAWCFPESSDAKKIGLLNSSHLPIPQQGFTYTCDTWLRTNAKSANKGLDAKHMLSVVQSLWHEVQELIWDCQMEKKSGKPLAMGWKATVWCT